MQHTYMLPTNRCIIHNEHSHAGTEMTVKCAWTGWEVLQLLRQQIWRLVAGQYSGGACVVSCRDPTRLNLSPFRSLVRLELLGCDLSTSAWLGADVLRLQLRSLSCRDSLEELWHLLAPSADRPTSQGACNRFHCPQSSLPHRKYSWQFCCFMMHARTMCVCWIILPSMACARALRHPSLQLVCRWTTAGPFTSQATL